MTNEEKLIDKCNRMAFMIGTLHFVLSHQYNLHPNKGLKACLDNLNRFLDKEVYEISEPPND